MPARVVRDGYDTVLIAFPMNAKIRGFFLEVHIGHLQAKQLSLVKESRYGLSTECVNAQHIKGVPECKTDVTDVEWIADLVRHGLVKASYIPSREQRELQEITRYR